MRKLCIAICLLMWSGATALAQSSSERDFVVSDLRSNKSQPAPLLVAMHGSFSNPKAFRTQSRLDATARKYGMIVVYPATSGGDWLDGSNGQSKKDVEYLARLIASMRADPRVLDQPVLMVGHGAGGAMALRMACERPELIAGLGVVATKLPKAYPCSRGRPKPAMFLHGTADPISPHDGNDDTLSAAQTLSVWQARNRCNSTLRVSRIDQNKRDKTSVVNRRYAQCQAALTHVVILGQGHDWPTGRASGGDKFGPQTGELNANETLFTFLSPLIGR